MAQPCWCHERTTTHCGDRLPPSVAHERPAPAPEA
jgi:hypothetical protein